MLQPRWGWISHTQVARGRSAGTRPNPGLKDGIPLGFETTQPTAMHAPAKACIERGDSALGGFRRRYLGTEILGYLTSGAVVRLRGWEFVRVSLRELVQGARVFGVSLRPAAAR